MRGGYGASGHGSLHERIHGTPAPGAGESAREGLDGARGEAVNAAPPSPARHCYVDGEPSLLLEWRAVADGWEGRVVSLRWLGAEGWATVERWLPSGDLHPA